MISNHLLSDFFNCLSSMDLTKLTEKDLYLPVKTLFEAKGYTVKGEVKHCDLVAQSEGKLEIVSLKFQVRGSLSPLYS